MEKLTVSQVTDLMWAEGISDSLLTDLAGMAYCMHKFVHMYVCVIIIICFHRQSH